MKRLEGQENQEEVNHLVILTHRQHVSLEKGHPANASGGVRGGGGGGGGERTEKRQVSESVQKYVQQTRTNTCCEKQI